MSAPPTTIDELRHLVNTGTRVKYLYFWGNQPRLDGTLGPSCLSQWWPSPFDVDGVHFRSAEHYMMWRKAQLFGDTATAARIVEVGHPKQAKDLGRRVKGFDDATWERERFAIVTDVSRAKFASTDALRTYLVGTGTRVLVEASPLDRVWGIGLAADDEAAANPLRWRGLNLLGFALMQARHDLATGA
ncbi:NADAR family protein [Dactylosporangium vinaceum]|uniref:NADAR family protein n=1 Tax=Dactylosporangium vinaceum TaxID=53362 RepID=A0ABV5M5L9_9ACTN|nr:NADAR family protein [Dactylosporangium vinaceum]UAB95573.1 NADAR family protein [Dactylosporangium vinaceum]